jgi:hypothetical protein
MKSPEEVAEEMLNCWELAPERGLDGLIKWRQTCLGFFAQALTTYAEERVKEAVKETHRTMEGLRTVMQRTKDLTDGFDDGKKVGRAEGYAEARDDAARIAQFYNAPRVEHRVTPWAAGDIAERIRALKRAKNDR